MAEERTDAPVTDKLDSILQEKTFDNRTDRTLKKENQELKQIVECLRPKIERTKSHASACRRPDLQAQYDILERRNNALRAQLISVRAELDGTERKYKDARDSVHFFQIIHQSLR